MIFVENDLFILNFIFISSLFIVNYFPAAIPIMVNRAIADRHVVAAFICCRRTAASNFTKFRVATPLPHIIGRVGRNIGFHIAVS